jgi:hypothetical protein
MDPVYETVVEEFDVLAPSGNRLYGLVRRPDPLPEGMCFPAVVVVPGGLGAGRQMAHRPEVEALAGAGMVVLAFNAEGRGVRAPGDIPSEGTEDYNGFRHQDGLCAVLEHAMAIPYVIPENVGVWTNSYGITMGAGCLGRRPELGVKYLVDGEGPSNSYVTAFEPYSLDDDPANDRYQAALGNFGHLSTTSDPSPENVAFWEEREADRYIGGFRGMYLRLQAEWDHAQPPRNPEQVPVFHQPPEWWQNKHAADMVNAAVAGGVPWVRVNLTEHGNVVNDVYDADHQPVYLEGRLADEPWGVIAVLEMAVAP